MCDFNNMDDTAKADYHRQLTRCADAFGGTNFFLQLLEAIRKTKPHPLMAKHMEFRFSRGIVVWNKAADIVKQYVKKGDALYVEGKISTSSWDDKEGNRHYSTEIICENFLFLSQRNSGGAVSSVSEEKKPVPEEKKPEAAEA